MCNSPSALNIPPRLADLEMTLGDTTMRSVASCPESAFHTVVYDAWALWDPMLQDHVFAESCGNETCNDCLSPLRNKDVPARNEEAIEIMRENMIKLTRTLTARAAECDTKKWLKVVCEICGDQTVQIDAYAAIDETTLVGEVVTTFDKGHTCEECRTDVRGRDITLSNHEVLELKSAMLARAQALTDELRSIDDWLCVNGEDYGLSSARCDELSPATRLK